MFEKQKRDITPDERRIHNAGRRVLGILLNQAAIDEQAPDADGIITVRLPNGAYGRINPEGTVIVGDNYPASISYKGTSYRIGGNLVLSEVHAPTGDDGTAEVVPLKPDSADALADELAQAA